MGLMSHISRCHVLSTLATLSPKLLYCSKDSDDWTPGYPEAVLVHHFAGSWKNDDQQPEAALQAALQGADGVPLYR